jgi:hypothetical protein
MTTKQNERAAKTPWIGGWLSLVGAERLLYASGPRRVNGYLYSQQRLTIQAINAGGTLADMLTFKNSQVGIGTTSPSDVLEIKAACSDNGVTLNNTGQSAGQLTTLLFKNDAWPTVSSAIKSKLIAGASQTELQFFTANGSASAQRMVIDTTGQVGIGKTSPATKLDVVGTISGSTVLGSNGITTKVIAGACSDANAQNTNGTLCVDSSNGRIYFRYGGAWHYAAQTAGFQIPSIERNGRLETEGLAVGDAVIGRIDERMEDGAMHGIWEKLDLQSEITAALRAHPELLEHVGTQTGATSLSIQDLRDLTLQGALMVYGNATFFGDVEVRGTFSLSERQKGVVIIPAGQTEAKVVYTHAFHTAPDVTATPKGVPGSLWGVTEEAVDGFTIALASPAMQDTRFSWLAIPLNGERDETPEADAVSSSLSSTSESFASQEPFYVNERGVP